MNSLDGLDTPTGYMNTWIEFLIEVALGRKFITGLHFPIWPFGKKPCLYNNSIIRYILLIKIGYDIHQHTYKAIPECKTP